MTNKSKVNNNKRITKKERFDFIIDYFSNNNPNAGTELKYTTPYELIVAVILSAQCTDKRVNMITPPFFNKFPDINNLAKAEEKDVYELIKSCSYPNSKTRNLIGMAKKVRDIYNGIIPDEQKDLMNLPGVGRKTANVIASVVYNKPALAVDSHVFRVSARIGLTTNAKTPLDAEKQLVKYIPENKLSVAHHWLILHGRYVCKARNPDCDSCEIKRVCRYYQKNMSVLKKN